MARWFVVVGDLIAIAQANLLIERLLVSSDPFDAYVCDKCGLLARPGWCQYVKTGCGRAVEA